MSQGWCVHALDKIVCFILLSLLLLEWTLPPSAYSVPEVITEATRSLSVGPLSRFNQPPQAVMPSIQIPKEFGEVNDSYIGTKPQTFFLIQDAHAVGSAQESLNSILNYLVDQHGVRAVGLEGASGRIDTSILESYPNQTEMKKLLKKLISRGELSGAIPSGLRQNRRVELEGIENWDLYEKGVTAFLRAWDQRGRFWKKLAALQRRHNLRKVENYSKRAKEYDQRLTAWKQGKVELDQLLSHLFLIQKPDQNQFPKLRRVYELMALEVSDAVRSQLIEVEAFVKERLSSAEIRIELNQKKQELETGQCSLGEFAAYLLYVLEVVLLEENGTQGFDADFVRWKKFFELGQIYRDFDAMSGSVFFDELEPYLSEVDRHMFRPAELKLHQFQKVLWWMSKAVTFELTSSDWKRFVNEGEHLAQRKQVIGQMRDEFENHFQFYEIALQREAAFFQNLLKMAQSSDTWPIDMPVAVVTGGFHIEGLKSRLSELGFSYVVVTPKVRVPIDRGAYARQMHGKVSWAKFFKEENGEVNIFNAFHRYVIDEVIKSIDGDSGRRRMLREWRDNVIRALANRDRLHEAASCTRLLDASIRQIQRSFDVAVYETKLRNRFDTFLSNLERLVKNDQLNPKNATKMFGVGSSIVPYSLSIVKNQTVPAWWVRRSEMRSDRKMLEVKPNPSTIRTLNHLRSMFPAENQPTIHELALAIDYSWAGDPLDVEQPADGPAVVILTAGPILKYFPKNLLPKELPWQFVYMHDESFESLSALAGNAEHPELNVNPSSVNFYWSNSKIGSRKNRKMLFQNIPVNAYTSDEHQKIFRLVRGAHTIIRARTGHPKEEILTKWAAALSYHGVLGNRMIALPGDGISPKDIDLIEEESSQIVRKSVVSKWTSGNSFLQSVLGKTTIYSLDEGDDSDTWSRPLSRVGLIPTAVGGARKFPDQAKWLTTLSGVAPAAVLSYLIHDPALMRTFLDREAIGEEARLPREERLKLYVRSGGTYGPKESSVLTVIMNRLALDEQMKIVGIEDLSRAVVAVSGSEIPWTTIREFNQNQSQGHSVPLSRVELPLSTRMEQKDSNQNKFTKRKRKFHFEETDILMLTSGPHHFFTKEDAIRFKGRVLMELGPDLLSPEAIKYLEHSGILIIPFAALSIGWSYEIFTLILHALEKTPQYNSRTHIMEGIVGYTLGRLWLILERARADHRQSIAEHIAALDDELVRRVDALTDEFHLMFGKVHGTYAVLADDVNVRMNRVPADKKKQMTRVLNLIQKHQEMPYVIALREAAFRVAFSEFIGENIDFKTLTKLLTSRDEYNQPEHHRGKREAAVFLMGHGTFNKVSNQEIFGVIESHLTHAARLETGPAVLAQTIKTVGRLALVESIPLLLKVQATIEQRDSGVREWTIWALRRIKRVNSTLVQWSEEIKKVEKIELKEALMAVQRLTVGRAAIDPSLFSLFQGPYRHLAEIQIKLATLYELNADMQGAAEYYLAASQNLDKAEKTGGLMSSMLRLGSSSLLRERARLLKTKASNKELDHALTGALQVAIPTLAHGIGAGAANKNDKAGNLAENYFNSILITTFAYGGYLKLALREVLELAGLSRDVSEYFATAVKDFIMEWEFEKRSGFGPKLERSEGFVIAPESSSLGSYVAALRKIEKIKFDLQGKFELLRRYEKSPFLVQLVDEYLGSEKMMILYWLAASEIHAAMPEISMQIARTISRTIRDPKNSVPRDIIEAPSLNKKKFRDKFGKKLQPIAEKYGTDISHLHEANKHLKRIYKQLGILPKLNERRQELRQTSGDSEDRQVVEALSSGQMAALARDRRGGFLLARLRNQLNLSLTQLETLSGVKREKINEIERGRTEQPKQSTIEKLMNGFRQVIRSAEIAQGVQEWLFLSFHYALTFERLISEIERFGKDHRYFEMMLLIRLSLNLDIDGFARRIGVKPYRFTKEGLKKGLKTVEFRRHLIEGVRALYAQSDFMVGVESNKTEHRLNRLTRVLLNVTGMTKEDLKLELEKTSGTGNFQEAFRILRNETLQTRKGLKDGYDLPTNTTTNIEAHGQLPRDKGLLRLRDAFEEILSKDPRFWENDDPSAVLLDEIYLIVNLLAKSNPKFRKEHLLKLPAQHEMSKVWPEDNAFEADLGLRTGEIELDMTEQKYQDLLHPVLDGGARTGKSLAFADRNILDRYLAALGHHFSSNAISDSLQVLALPSWRNISLSLEVLRVLTALFTGAKAGHLLLRLTREQLGISISQLSKVTGVESRQIERLEAGENGISGTIVKLTENLIQTYGAKGTRELLLPDKEIREAYFETFLNVYNKKEFLRRLKKLAVTGDGGALLKFARFQSLQALTVFARKIGIAPVNYANIEMGQTENPKKETLNKILTFLLNSRFVGHEPPLNEREKKEIKRSVLQTYGQVDAKDFFKRVKALSETGSPGRLVKFLLTQFHYTPLMFEEEFMNRSNYLKSGIINRSSENPSYEVISEIKRGFIALLIRDERFSGLPRLLQNLIDFERAVGVAFGQLPLDELLRRGWEIAASGDLNALSKLLVTQLHHSNNSFHAAQGVNPHRLQRDISISGKERMQKLTEQVIHLYQKDARFLVVAEPRPVASQEHIMQLRQIIDEARRNAVFFVAREVARTKGPKELIEYIIHPFGFSLSSFAKEYFNSAASLNQLMSNPLNSKLFPAIRKLLSAIETLIRSHPNSVVNEDEARLRAHRFQLLIGKEFGQDDKAALLQKSEEMAQSGQFRELLNYVLNQSFHSPHEFLKSHGIGKSFLYAKTLPVFKGDKLTRIVSNIQTLYASDARFRSESGQKPGDDNSDLDQMMGRITLSYQNAMRKQARLLDRDELMKTAQTLAHSGNFVGLLKLLLREAVTTENAFSRSYGIKLWNYTAREVNPRSSVQLSKIKNGFRDLYAQDTRFFKRAQDAQMPEVNEQALDRFLALINTAHQNRRQFKIINEKRSRKDLLEKSFELAKAGDLWGLLELLLDEQLTNLYEFKTKTGARLNNIIRTKLIPGSKGLESIAGGFESLYEADTRFSGKGKTDLSKIGKAVKLAAIEALWKQAEQRASEKGASGLFDYLTKIHGVSSLDVFSRRYGLSKEVLMRILAGEMWSQNFSVIRQLLDIFESLTHHHSRLSFLKPSEREAQAVRVRSLVADVFDVVSKTEMLSHAKRLAREGNFEALLSYVLHQGLYNLEEFLRGQRLFPAYRRDMASDGLLREELFVKISGKVGTLYENDFRFKKTNSQNEVAKKDVLRLLQILRTGYEQSKKKKFAQQTGTQRSGSARIEDVVSRLILLFVNKPLRTRFTAEDLFLSEKALSGMFDNLYAKVEGHAILEDAHHDCCDVSPELGSRLAAALDYMRDELELKKSMNASLAAAKSKQVNTETIASQIINLFVRDEEISTIPEAVSFGLSEIQFKKYWLRIQSKVREKMRTAALESDHEISDWVRERLHAALDEMSLKRSARVKVQKSTLADEGDFLMRNVAGEGLERAPVIVFKLRVRAKKGDWDVIKAAILKGWKIEKKEVMEAALIKFVLFVKTTNPEGSEEFLDWLFLEKSEVLGDIPDLKAKLEALLNKAPTDPIMTESSLNPEEFRQSANLISINITLGEKLLLQLEKWNGNKLNQPKSNGDLRVPETFSIPWDLGRDGKEHARRGLVEILTKWNVSVENRFETKQEIEEHVEKRIQAGSKSAWNTIRTFLQAFGMDDKLYEIEVLDRKKKKWTPLSADGSVFDPVRGGMAIKVLKLRDGKMWHVNELPNIDKLTAKASHISSESGEKIKILKKNLHLPEIATEELVNGVTRKLIHFIHEAHESLHEKGKRGNEMNGSLGAAAVEIHRDLTKLGSNIPVELMSQTQNFYELLQRVHIDLKGNENTKINNNQLMERVHAELRRRDSVNRKEPERSEFRVTRNSSLSLRNQRQSMIGSVLGVRALSSADIRFLIDEVDQFGFSEVRVSLTHSFESLLPQLTHEHVDEAIPLSDTLQAVMADADLSFSDIQAEGDHQLEQNLSYLARNNANGKVRRVASILFYSKSMKERLIQILRTIQTAFEKHGDILGNEYRISLVGKASDVKVLRTDLARMGLLRGVDFYELNGTTQRAADIKNELRQNVIEHPDFRNHFSVFFPPEEFQYFFPWKRTVSTEVLAEDALITTPLLIDYFSVVSDHEISAASLLRALPTNLGDSFKFLHKTGFVIHSNLYRAFAKSQDLLSHAA
jgi:transcriptional regulator with XRE-family HTH domain